MRSIVRAVSLLAVLAGTAKAGEVTSITARIPFAFTAADREFPAGDYSLEMKAEAGQLAIRGPKGAPVVLRTSNLSLAGDVYQDAQRFEVVLRRYEDAYFLAQVWIKNNGVEVPKSSSEKAKEDGGQQARTLKLRVKPR